MNSDNSMDSRLESAFQKVLEDVHARAFLYKMAQTPFAPQTEEDALALLQLGFKLQAAEAAAAASGATKSASLAAEANAALDSLFPQQAAAAQKQASDNEAQAVALELAKDPEIFEAARLLVGVRNMLQNNAS